MNNSRLMLVLLCSLTAGAPASAATPQCIEFPQPSKADAVLTQPGSYCMTRDLIVRVFYNSLVWEGSNYRAESKFALVLGSGDVIVDLQGNSIRSNVGAFLSGVLGSVVASYSGLEPGKARIESIDWNKANKNVVIKNGTIELTAPPPGPIGILLATDREAFGVPDNYNEPRFLFRSDFSYLPKDREAYPNRKITLENLTIRAPGYGIAVFGAGTVIRNCTIVTESGVGIWSFGGGAVIENNTITVRRNKRLTKTFLPTDAAIVLQDGHDSIVRNNVMHLGSEGLGISLVNSGNVSMSGNVSKGWIRSEPPSVREFK
jgi:Right handed beta helix region